MGKAIFIVSGFLLMLVGCQPAKVEVKIEKFADQTKNWEIQVSKSVFTSASAGVEQGCESVNMRIQHLVDSLQQSIKIEADTFFTTYAKVDTMRPEFTYQLWITDSVFMATDRFISLRLLVYTYEGGAHGRTDFYGINYNVKEKRFETPQQIVDYNKAGDLNPLLEKFFNNEKGCFTEKPALENSGLAAINVSDGGVCFTYGHYALGAYACGYAEITIPFAGLKEAEVLLLSPDLF